MIISSARTPSSSPTAARPTASIGLMCHGNGHVLACALHLLANVKKPRNRDTGFSDALFWRLQAAETEEAFETNMEEIALKFPRTASYLREQPPLQWTLWSWIARGDITYGRKTSNPVEQIHSAQLHMRYRSPLAFVEEYPIQRRITCGRSLQDREGTRMPAR